MPQITVLDGYTTNPGDNPWDPIRDLGEVTVYDRTPEEAIPDRASGAEILLTNKTPLDEETLRALDDLEFVSVLATGYDPVDVEAARELGIPVANVPEYSTDSVAEHTIGLMLELTHRIGMLDRAVEAGEWENSPDFSFWKRSLTELSGKTLGIVGFGTIGERVGRVADAFGMTVLGSTHSSTPDPAFEEFEHVETDAIFERADIVSLHCPLTDETEQMVDADRLEAMGEEAYLVNTGRGDLVDEAAVADALADGSVAGAAVDVVSEEPITSDNPLLDAPNCVITPHIAWTSLEARQRLMQTTAKNVRGFLAGDPTNVVNG
ncbi:MAG: D-2-hydroxyacid dehydrogenase [Bradymonadaceae bacterium]